MRPAPAQTAALRNRRRQFICSGGFLAWARRHRSAGPWLLCCARASSARGCPDGRRVASRFRWARLLARRRRWRSTGLPSRSMRPALKTGKHKLGACAARGGLPSPRAYSRLRSCAGAAEGNAAVCWYLARGGRGGRDHKPTEPQHVHTHVSVASAVPRWVSHAGRAEERAWRQFDVR